MGLHITHVDAFTSKPFAGNPAGVCILDVPRTGAWMQLLAGELNLPDSAFLLRKDAGFDLRWFTPAVEIELCGHATLATAHVLWEEGHLPDNQIAQFHTKTGPLTAEKKGDWIEMDFPALPVEAEPRLEPLAAALGAKARFAGRSRFDYFVEVGSEEELRALQPNFSALRQWTVRGVIVTSRASGRDYDFVSRFFAPASGVDEDPVTGSAHCVLAPFWSERLGRDELTGYQASARGGVVRTKCVGERVRLSGQAVTVLRAELV